MKKQFKDIKIGQQFNFCLSQEFGIETFIKTSENLAKLDHLINGCQFTYEFKCNEIVEI